MNRHRRPRTGFTLVELLVVIAIIGVLMGLLLPAVQSARESGRRATCSNNQYQMAFAAIRFNDTYGFLPGWRNSLPWRSTVPVNSGTFFASWPVMLLPFVERNDIYKNWQIGTASSPYVSLFVCPSSPPDAMTSAMLAYAGNCGSANSTRSNGVMVDTVNPSARLSLDDISNQDGTGTTLLISERCISGTAGLALTLWSNTFNSGNTFSFSILSTAVPGFGIVGTAAVPKIVNSPVAGPPGQASQPSSNHPGGAVAAFCDGRTLLLKDSLTQNVYGRLVTSDGVAASALGATNVGAALVWTGTTPPAPPPPLSDGDYQ